MKSINFIITAIISVICHYRRKKNIGKINITNKINKRIDYVGNVYSNRVIPDLDSDGNIIVTGGSENVRNKLIIQNCRQSLNNGAATVVIHEKNTSLESDIKNIFGHNYYCRIINQKNSYYDPLIDLSDHAIADLLVDAASESMDLNAEVMIYLRTLSFLARRQGINPYVKRLAIFPIYQYHQIIENLLLHGRISYAEAASARKGLGIGVSDLAKIDMFFSRIKQECCILAGKNEMKHATSIAKCSNKSGIISIDIGACTRNIQLGLIRAELKKCIDDGIPLRIIIDAKTLINNPKLIMLLKGVPFSVHWTLSTSDICTFVDESDNLSQWVTSANKVIIFSSGLGTSELLSSEIGDFDYIEIVNSHGGGNSFGSLGFNFGLNETIYTKNSRERIIKPEEIRQLGAGEFVCVDNFSPDIIRGVLI